MISILDGKTGGFFMKTKIRNRVVSLLIAALMLWGFASQAAALSETVVVPFNVGQIGYNAFYKDGSSIKIICEPDSFAEQFAQQNGLDYELTEGGEEVVIEDESFEPGEPQMAKASTRGGVPLISLASVGVVSGVIIMAIIAIIIAKNNRKNPKA